MVLLASNEKTPNGNVRINIQPKNQRIKIQSTEQRFLRKIERETKMNKIRNDIHSEPKDYTNKYTIPQKKETNLS